MVCIGILSRKLTALMLTKLTKKKTNAKIIHIEIPFLGFS